MFVYINAPSECLDEYSPNLFVTIQFDKFYGRKRRGFAEKNNITKYIIGRIVAAAVITGIYIFTRNSAEQSEKAAS